MNPNSAIKMLCEKKKKNAVWLWVIHLTFLDRSFPHLKNERLGLDDF